MNDNGGDYIVCGWYTPNYAHWAETLKASLDVVGERYDFVEVERYPGGWETQTLRKPHEIWKAMMRHPRKTVVFLDVDCVVLQSLEPVARISGDVGLHPRWKILRGTGRMTMRSGTMVVRPTAAAFTFLAEWTALSDSAPYGTVDQMTLLPALAATPGISVSFLDNAACAIASDKVRNPVVLHDSASSRIKKVPKVARSIARVIGRIRDVSQWRTA